MSGIYIPNMEMPKVCYKNCNQYCFVFYRCSIVKKYLDIENDTSQEDIYHKRLDGCPLKEVPPHEELISREDVLSNMEGDGFYSARKIVRSAPTILETSE